MKSLIIDASQDQLAVVVIDGEKVYKKIGEKGARRHTKAILTSIEELLTEAQVLPKEIEGIGVVVGPGSFTGIRIGVATANAFAKATLAKICELTSLEVLAYNKDNVLALLDCKHDNYYALFRNNGEDVYVAINASEIDGFNAKECVYYEEPNVDNLVATYLEKVKNGQYKKVAEPFYMKKSSAEN
ncbi:MAG: tRNA (adenosine(37)-N6)-threonylcarbamoyltransferase complex dimerization subunit type 1 TsaB [Clostridia bacterium]|nr:tRNA (adenosine(37)-N6)-threonylcarbamoyltransferase complex dimerization subunit type 1 TsaB [Clostridia bacterium]